MKYNHRKIEKGWQKQWLKEKIYEPFFAPAAAKATVGKPDLTHAKRPFYNLMMFPYPSAEGLHVGNMYAFVGADIYGRFKRMHGYDVFEPIGLDGFGIHAENYALKIKKHPAEQAKISEKNFYRQLVEIGNGFSWDEHLETYDSEYYKWTQWIFVQMFKHGLAYRKKQAVNWCPDCKTVLADEQVLSGECERCGTKVMKRELEQWFFRITKYAEKLLKGLDGLDWSEKIKIAQKNWIGKSEGALIDFTIKGTGMNVEVFTTRPDTIFGATFLVLSPENPLVTALEFEMKNRKEVTRYVEQFIKHKETSTPHRGRSPNRSVGEKKGIELKGVKAINPATKKEIPIWVADYVVMEYGTGAIMAVPAHDERDFEFAKEKKLPIKFVVVPPADQQSRLMLSHLDLASGNSKSRTDFSGPYTGIGFLIDSDRYSGFDSEKAKWAITKFVKGKKEIHYRLRDWLISRQRYWGPPIPMIFCPHCAHRKMGERNDMPGWYSVPEKDLPVRLPKIKDFRPKGEGVSPLAKVPSFYEVKCPKCNHEAVRETDVSDTFLDSAWYYLGYLMQNQKSKIKNQNYKAKNKSPWDQAVVRKWLPVDMYIGGAEHAVLHLLYVRFMAKVFHDWKLVDFDEPAKKFRAHGLLIRDGKKISKSKGNIINPDQFISEFGADALRMHLMFLGPFEEGGDFHDQGIMGPVRFLERVWERFNSVAKFDLPRSKDSNGDVNTAMSDEYFHRAIKKITGDIKNLRYNTAVSALMMLLNDMVTLKVYDSRFLVLLAPFAPHMAEELWRNVLGHKTSIHREPWPVYDKNKIAEKTFTLVIQVNGKVRDTVDVTVGISESDARELALSREKIKNAVGEHSIKRIIYIPGRLMNIVL